MLRSARRFDAVIEPDAGMVVDLSAKWIEPVKRRSDVLEVSR